MADYSKEEIKKIEQKWQEKWEKDQVYKVSDASDKPKYYVLDMFPYPSGAGLHVGHPLGYIASDIVSRYKRLKGFNVLHPMGFDAFGLPAEQYAIQTGQHPAKTTEKNIETYKRQLRQIGFSYDWSREVQTCDPDYYKWTQWIFMQLFNAWYNKKSEVGNQKLEDGRTEPIAALIAELEKNGNKNVVAVCDEDTPVINAEQWRKFNEIEKENFLQKYRIAYQSETMVNWCAALGTVLSNDEVKDGVSERGGYPVERIKMLQWSMRITAYAERLLKGLDTIDWPEPVKEMQRNWIGKSVGCELEFSPAPDLSLTPNPSPGEKGRETADKKVWHILKEFAKDNRSNPTEEESILWNELRNSKLGHKIRRQHAIGTFIADFVCLDKRLVIEVDGDYHLANKEFDEARTEFLNSEGFNVIRLTNQEVQSQLQKTLTQIKNSLDNSTSIKQSSSLSPGEGRGEAIKVFTTRIDTIYGVTFMVLAPEHELVDKITTAEQRAEVTTYVETAKNRSERERMSEVKRITGAFTGAYVINPFNNKKVPVWIADYVLAGYGTGAVMAVPSSDTRDYAFATYFNLPIVNVLEGATSDITKDNFDPKSGTMINSDFLNGLDWKVAIEKALEKVESLGIGTRKINFRLRDAIFGRQRYWGEPFPVYYKDGLPQLVEEENLPITLPEIDEYKPTESGEPPLARAKDWKYTPSLTPTPSTVERGIETADKKVWRILKEFGRDNRKNPTDEEAILWENVRNNKLGHKIRRQHTIGTFIADFVCLDKQLVIEVDGEYHLSNKDFDEARTAFLNNEGFEVIRFTNAEVNNNLKKVLTSIKNKLDKSTSIKQSNSLSLGEGWGEAYPFELTTMPGWAGSSWYWFRYMDPHNDNEFASKEKTNYWKDVDLYMGGSEHATGHLLYSRFWCKALKDLGFVDAEEPFKKLINQGHIQGVSKFVYRALVHWTTGDLKPSPKFYPTIFLSKGVYDKLQVDIEQPKKDLSKFTEAIKIIENSLSEINDRHTISGNLQSGEFRISYEGITPLHVDINIVQNDHLDTGKFKLWRDDFRNAEFILEEGNYLVGSEVEKMSKSKYNVVNPDEIVNNYGADTLRLYEMFLGPLELSKPWNTQGIDGVYKFLRRFWNLFHDKNGNFAISEEVPTREELKVLHKTLKKIAYDIEHFSFNTSVSEFMICANELSSLKCNKRGILEPLCIALSPYAPHIAEELWQLLGHSQSILFASFPVHNEEYLTESSHEYPISINGKVRAKMNFALDMPKEDIEKIILASEVVLKWSEGKPPKKVIVVHGKIVNVVL
jgi:leucyl-tRNA synthetase